MHHFRFDIGDYLKEAGFLPPLEQGVYLLLRLHYFATERPIPVEDALVIGKAGEHVVTRVLERFFSRRAAGWYHAGFEAKLAEFNRKFQNYSAAGKRGGGRPKKGSFSKPFSDLKTPHNLITSQELEQKIPASADADTGGESAAFAAGVEAKTTKADRKRAKCPFEKIVAIYHAELPTLRRVEKLTKTRAGFIRQRWIEDLPTAAHWERYFRFVARSDFLMGRADATGDRPPFRVDLEWLTRPGNFAKVKEEKYHG